MTYLFIANSPKSHRIYKEEEKIAARPRRKRFSFLKSDVAKLGRREGKSKKMASTTGFCKTL
ncbi:hypothetical protein DWZ09_02920 [Bacteroides cellulosilyticus]|nr:hypothetical protein DWZ09_02920 [Bacteroides cellulosilyticus]